MEITFKPSEHGQFVYSSLTGLYNLYAPVTHENLVREVQYCINPSVYENEEPSQQACYLILKYWDNLIEEYKKYED